MTKPKGGYSEEQKEKIRQRGIAHYQKNEAKRKANNEAREAERKVKYFGELSKRISEKIPGLYLVSIPEDIKPKVVVEDKDGFTYEVFPASLDRGNHPIISTCTNPNALFQFKVNRLNPDIKIIGDYISAGEPIVFRYSDRNLYKLNAGTLIEREVGTPFISTALYPNKVFADRARLVHGDKYDYSKFVFEHSRSKSIITCPVHGDFVQAAITHLGGSSCEKCNNGARIEKLKVNCSGWRFGTWKKAGLAKGGKPKVYIVQLSAGDEDFIKIGRTYNEISKRFSKAELVHYKYALLHKYEGTYEEMFSLETELHKLCRECKYVPKFPFNGKQECFSWDAFKKLDMASIIKSILGARAELQRMINKDEDFQMALHFGHIKIVEPPAYRLLFNNTQPPREDES